MCALATLSNLLTFILYVFCEIALLFYILCGGRTHDTNITRDARPPASPAHKHTKTPFQILRIRVRVRQRSCGIVLHRVSGRAWLHARAPEMEI